MSKPRTNGLRIMVIDSSDVSRKLISRALTSGINNIDIISCKRADEALVHLKNWEKFDIITTSLMLEDMDGLELCKYIRKIDRHNYTPVIVVSGDADERLLNEGFAAGVTDYFDKSKGYPELVTFIKKFSFKSQLSGKILYIEDSLTSARVTQRILSNNGLDVTHSTTAEEALEILVSVADDPSDDFDMVITDFYLEGELTGGDLLHSIRAMLRRSFTDLPVLVITAVNNPNKESEIFHAGANDYVTKPFVEEVLLARINSLLLIKQQHEKIKLLENELSLVAYRDHIPGVYHKQFLVEKGDELLAQEENLPLAIFHLDINNFSKFNEKYGELFGDKMIVEYAKFLVKFFPPEAILVHHKEDDFYLLLKNFNSENCKSIILKLHDALESQLIEEHTITISVGISNSEEHSSINLSKLMSLASEALDAARRHGDHSSCIFTKHDIICF